MTDMSGRTVTFSMKSQMSGAFARIKVIQIRIKDKVHDNCEVLVKFLATKRDFGHPAILVLCNERGSLDA